MERRIALIFLSALALFASDWDEGKATAQGLLNVYKGSMDSRINKPLTSKTPLKTIDNSQSGVVNLTCGEQKPFVYITYQGSGDITIYVKEDLDLDGNYDTYKSITGVSGICSNGFIKCTPNTWKNCGYYKYTFANGLSYERIAQKELGGCYCINSSCGNLAATEKYQILNDIAGGISQVYKESRNYIISKIANSGNDVYLWGQGINCQNKSIPTNVNQYTIDSEAENKKMGELANQEGAYYYVTQGASNTNKNGNIDASFKSEMSTRTSTAKKTASFDQGNKAYSYTDKTSTGTTNVSGTLNLGGVEGTLYCEVEWIEKDTSAFADETNKAQSTASATTKKRDIRECRKENNKWVCPIDPSRGETIKHDCGSINDFNEVVSAMAGINEAVKDFACSTN